MSTFGKNRDRDKPTFANINLLGKCSAQCFFCLGEDMRDELDGQNQLRTRPQDMKNFISFIDRCESEGIEKIYITGQNTDPMCYHYLKDMIDMIQSHGSGSLTCGLRLNGYGLDFDAINMCKEEIGYSVHALSPVVNKMIVGRSDIPDWRKIFRMTNPKMRVAMVANRCNEATLMQDIKQISSWIKAYAPLPCYIQIRRVSTDTRQEELLPDIAAFERFYTRVKDTFTSLGRLWQDADVFDMFGIPVSFWRTVKTSVNSYNYFSDGTISDEYFVVEGYLKNRKTEMLQARMKEAK